MKAKFTILLMVFYFYCNGQTHLNFTFKEINDVRQTTDSIVSNAKRSYKFKSIQKYTDDTTSYVVKYININDSTDNIPVLIRTRIVDGNNDLEIKGTTEYSIKFTQGKFLDLFPFWKRFININSIDKKIIEKGYDTFESNKMIFNFKRVTDNIWTISM